MLRIHTLKQSVLLIAIASTVLSCLCVIYIQNENKNTTNKIHIGYESTENYISNRNKNTENAIYNGYKNTKENVRLDLRTLVGTRPQSSGTGVSER